jgi:iron complex transport system ATP-binding protein
MLETTQLAVSRGARCVLSGVSLSFLPGRLAVIAGPNGAGKSTLIKALSGELPPAHGAVYLDSDALHQMPAAALAARRAVVPQATVLSFPFTVLEVVRLGSSVPGFGFNKNNEHAQAALAAVDLPHFAQRLYTQLSGGERQRVHFARALCQLTSANVSSGSTVLLLDEPTSNLDVAHQMLLLGRARDEARSGRIVIAVLHDLNLAATWADDVILIGTGGVVAQGPPEAIFSDSTLSELYDQCIRVNTTPSDGRPFILPQTMGRQRGPLSAFSRSDHDQPS